MKKLTILLALVIILNISKSRTVSNKIESSYLYNFISKYQSKYKEQDFKFLLKLFIDLGADLNVKDEFNRSLLQMEIEKESPNLKVIKTLINNSINLESCKKSNNINHTALYSAIFNKNLDGKDKDLIVSWLLKRGASTNIGNLTNIKLLFNNKILLPIGFEIKAQDTEDRIDILEVSLILNNINIKIILGIKEILNNTKKNNLTMLNLSCSRNVFIRSLYDLSFLPILLSINIKDLPESKKYSQIWKFILNFNNLAPYELREFITKDHKLYKQFKLLKLKKLLKLLREKALSKYYIYKMPKIPLELVHEIIEFNYKL